jgi:pimeloyl-ACP methyl ester carboxylesterase
MRKKGLLLIPVVLAGIYLAGPCPATPVYSKEMPPVPSDPTGLDAYVRNNEAQHKLKPDNEARIVWAWPSGQNRPSPVLGDSVKIPDQFQFVPFPDSLKHRTDYAIVYLHGFLASQGEGLPLHRDIAGKFGCNLYLSRLAEQGIDTVDQMIDLTADEYWESAKQALAIGLRLGKKVILIGTSTGGSLALQLAAAYPDSVAALILLSPNIAIHDPNAWVLNNHWGLNIARMVNGGPYLKSTHDWGPKFQQYWYSSSRLEGAVALEELIETTMNKETFRNVKQPVGMYYYYKDEAHQDTTVKVSAMLTMFDQLGTPAAMKYKQAFPEAGDHVICSPIRSQDAAGVETAVEKFMTDILHVPLAVATNERQKIGTRR